MTDRGPGGPGDPGVEIRGGVLARNTLLNVGGQLLPVVVAVAAMPAVVRGLGPDRFGLLGIAWMALYYFGELGFARATTRFTADALGRRDSADFAGVAWATVALQAAAGVALAVGLAAAAGVLAARVLEVPVWLVAEARLSFLLLAAVLPAVLVGAAFRGVLEAAQRFDLINLVRVPISMANFLLPLLGLWLGWALPGILALLLASRVLMLVIFAALALRLFPALRRPRRLPLARAREVLGYGGWVTVSGVVSPILTHLDRFMLGALVSIGAVGFYTAPYELVTRLWIIPASLVATLFPALSTLAGQGSADRVRGISAQAVKYVLLALGPVVVALLVAGPELLGLWLGAEFARESGLALRILAAGVLINSTAQIPMALLNGVGRPDLPARFHLIELPIQAVLVVVFIRLWGIPGAAAAWTIRVTLDTGLLFWAASRVVPGSFAALRPERVGRAVALLAAAAVVGVGAGLAVDGWARVAWAAVVALALAAAGWRWALGDADRGRFRRLAAFGAPR